MGKSAALYLRVSTTRQAEKDLSIPDQRRQAEAYCERKGWEVSSEYVEPGASATDDKRPAFQQMLADATSPDCPFDVIVVHSFSRFFRDAFAFEFNRRKLAKAGVQLVSMTQELGTDPMDDMVRQILNLFDEYQSKENAKHVLRAMKENARQGFWNGSKPPFGYRADAVEKRGDAIKKRLVVDSAEAETVKLIFSLFLEGKDGSGPLGIKKIMRHLNDTGVPYRDGRKFSTSLVHRILTRSTYGGDHYFNKRCAKTDRQKPKEEWVHLETPVIIPTDRLEAVLSLLQSRQPSKTPPRVTNGPTLLTGLAQCSKGHGMTIRTGKGGRYRYYACNKHMNKGGCDCSRKSIPMSTLDSLVLSQLEGRILEPVRLGGVLAELTERTHKAQVDAKFNKRKLSQQRRDVEAKLDRLYNALSEGHIENTDSFARKVAQLEAQRDEIVRQQSRLNRKPAIPPDILKEANLEAFTNAIRSKLRGPDPAFRRAYTRMLIDKVEVAGNEIRISGSKAALAAAVSDQSKGRVPSLEREWWSRGESNP